MTKLPPGTQIEMRNCVYCRDPFQPKRIDQAFCGTHCRSGYHQDHGVEGRISVVRRLARGSVSVITRYPAGPAADHAIALLPGDVVRTVKQPKVQR